MEYQHCKVGGQLDTIWTDLFVLISDIFVGARLAPGVSRGSNRFIYFVQSSSCFQCFQQPQSPKIYFWDRFAFVIYFAPQAILGVDKANLTQAAYYLFAYDIQVGISFLFQGSKSLSFLSCYHLGKSLANLR